MRIIISEVNSFLLFLAHSNGQVLSSSTVTVIFRVVIDTPNDTVKHDGQYLSVK